MGQQVAAAVAKMDAVAVSLELFVALRGEQDNVIASMKGQLDAIAQMQERASSSEGSATPASAGTTYDAWLGMIRVRFFYDLP